MFVVWINKNRKMLGSSAGSHKTWKRSLDLGINGKGISVCPDLVSKTVKQTQTSKLSSIGGGSVG